MHIKIGIHALVTVLVTISLIGCNVKNMASSGLSIEQPVQLDVQAGELSNANIEMDNQVLLIGANKLSPWLADQPDCIVCDVSVRLHYRPDGPTTFVVIEAKSSSWTFVNAFRPRVSIGDIQIVAGPGEVVIASVGSIQKPLILGQAVDLDDCRLTLLWAEATPPESSLYSDDQSKFSLQVLTVCKK